MSENDNIEIEYGMQLQDYTPIDFKGVTIYPVTYKYIYEFYGAINVLLYDPLRHPSIISTLPRLYFLTDILNHLDDEQYIKDNLFLSVMFQKLNVILGLVLINQRFSFVDVGSNKYALVVYKQTKTETQEIIIRAKDFEKMRKIILHQNAVDYDDTFVHEDIRQWIEEQEKAEKSPAPTIEDYRETYTIEMNIKDGWNIPQFYPMPLRHFNRTVDKILARENYNIKMQAVMCGFATFKDDITHWMVANKKNSIYEKYFKEIN